MKKGNKLAEQIQRALNINKLRTDVIIFIFMLMTETFIEDEFSLSILNLKKIANKCSRHQNGYNHIFFY